MSATPSVSAGHPVAAFPIVCTPPGRLGATRLLVVKELRDAWRNRWFLLYTLAFTVLALGLSWLSVVGVAGTGYASLGRTAGSLVSLVLLVVPLMGLTLGAQSIAGERERGALLYLLAQPIDVLEVVAAKFLGLTGAVVSALLFAFGIAAMALSGQSTAGQLRPFLAFLALALLLATASVAIGLLLSACASRASVAAGLALFGWLGLVLAGDLGIMGTALVLGLDARQLLLLALANPVQVFKVAAVLVLQGGLDALGPAGLYATTTWGASLVPALVGILLLWTVLPLAATVLVMRRRGGLA
jgi:Cu-processing system permease protein